MQTKIGCVKSFAVKCAHKCNFMRINATFVENKCNFLTFLLQQKLALLIRLVVLKRPGFQSRNMVCLDQLCPTRGPWAACGSIEGFVRPTSGFRSSKSFLYTTCPYFDNLEFDMFDAGGLQCHFITSVAITVRIRTLSVH